MFTPLNFSNPSAFLNNIPPFAPLPIPVIIAVGVASPNAHGQAITSTPTNTFTAIEKLSAIVQITPASTAIAITEGTKTADTLSAIRAIGALEFCASSTSRIIPESLVLSPTFSAKNSMTPVPLTVPP